MAVLQTVRLSHSEIFGLRIICIYPKLIAAYHVLHRLQEPRHPPYALSYLFASRFLRRGRCLLKVVLFVFFVGCYFEYFVVLPFLLVLTRTLLGFL